MQTFGTWTSDMHGLPTFDYTGPLPLVGSSDPQDPFFILGNYRLTSFVHASGRIMLFSTDRALARLNPGPTAAEGASQTVIAVDQAGQQHEVVLTGPHQIAAQAASKQFGCGFARFSYAGLPGDVRLTRNISTLPAQHHADGVPALLIHLELQGGSTACTVHLSETLDAAYDMGFWHNFPCRVRRVSYVPRAETAPGGSVAVGFTPVETVPLVLGDAPDDPAYADRFPAGIRLIPLDGVSCQPISTEVDAQTRRIGLRLSCTLAPGERRVLRCIVAVVRSEAEAKAATQRLLAGQANTHGATWAARLPTFADQPDAGLRQEMRWHAYVLHAMATWSEATQTTFIPQGTLYEYALGCSACLRDHMQHALPACYYDPDLARSVIRFAVRKTNLRGHVQGEDEGAGLIPEGTEKKSDNQIYALQLLAEYLLAQRDGAILGEEVAFQDGHRLGTVLDRAERWFRFLRDVVGIGPHGHIRVLRSDWNDCYHDFFPGHSYTDIMWFGESLLNTAQAIVVFDRLAQGLDQVQASLIAPLQVRAARLATAARAFRAELLPPFLALLATRDYCPKGRLREETFGDDPILLEPQGWTLLIPEVPLDKRRRIAATVRQQLLSGEAAGARLVSQPIPWFPSSAAWTRDNGGVWFALNGPLVLGALEVDPEWGRDLLERQTLRRRAQAYPQSWPGIWTGPDCYHSSHHAQPGAADHYTRVFPAFCAHAHAWPLYLALIAQTGT